MERYAFRCLSVRCFALLLVACLAGAPVWAQETVRDASPPAMSLLRALTRLQAGDAAAAVTLLQAALITTPDDAALLTALAEATAQTGDRTGARLYAERAVEVAPDAPEPARTLARLLIGAGDHVGARRVLDALLARTPAAAGARLDAARLAFDDGDAARTRALLAPLLDAPAPDVLDLALAAAPPGTPGRAALVAHALRFAPDRTGLSTAPAPPPTAPAIGIAPSGPDDGRAAFAAGRFAEALRLLTAALDADAADPVRWRFATMAALEAGQPDAAARLSEEGRLDLSRRSRPRRRRRLRGPRPPRRRRGCPAGVRSRDRPFGRPGCAGGRRRSPAAPHPRGRPPGRARPRPERPRPSTGRRPGRRSAGALMRWGAGPLLSTVA